MVTKKTILMLGFVLLVLLSSGSVCAVLDDAIRYYSIDDTDRTGNIVYDLAGNSNATNTGLTLGVTGIISEGAEGSGASGDYHIAYSSPADSSWSLSVWFKADTIANDMIWSSTVTADQYFQLVDNTHIDFYIGTSNNLAVSSLGTTWHHVVMTMDSCNAIIYLDNVNIDNQTYTSDCSLGAEAYWLADWNGGAGYELDGKIDEFALYDRVLTSSEVSTLYNSGNGYNPYHQVPTQPPEFTIYPETAYTADDLYADFTSTDADNDTIVFNWNWSNGTTEAIRFIDDGSLVSYYAMDDTEANTVYDYSGSNDGTMSGYTQNNGARNGGVEISTDNGKYGYGAGFDGVDDYIDIPLSEITGSKTLSIWFKPNDTTIGFLFSGGADIGSNIQIYYGAGNELNFMANNGTHKLYKAPLGVGDINLNEFNHIGFSYDSSANNFLCILNGVILYDGAPSSALQAGGFDGYIIGAVSSTPQYEFNGSIDEVRIWNKALTETEIQAEMESSNPVKGDGLVASYSFEQHNSTHALDTNHLIKGEIAEGIRFDGVDDYIDLSIINDTPSLTFSAWVKPKPTCDDGLCAIFTNINSQDSRGRCFVKSADGTSLCQIYIDGTQRTLTTTATYNFNSWNHFVFKASEGSQTVCINNVCKSNSYTGFIDSGTTDVLIGKDETANYYFNGSIDEVQIYNRSLSESEIEALYEGSRHYSNGTHAELDSSFTSTFATWTLDVTPYDYTAGGTLREVYAYIDDTLAPEITPDDISLNKTIVYSSDNLTAQINATDNFLYSINVSIDGTSIFNTSGIGATTYVYNLSQNMSSYSVGEHNISFRACDGHTSNQLNDKWNYDVGLSGLTFKDDKDKNKWYRINPTNNDIFERITTTRLKDRYDFKYQKSRVGKLFSKATEYSFIVESTEYIDIINPQQTDYKYKDKYKAWLVIKDIGQNGRWIDFNLKDVPEARYNIERLSPTKVRVTISNIPRNMKELVFESTGELNCVTETYEFYVYNYTTSYTTPVLETSSQTFTLNITKDSDYITDANATLHYNGTAYTPTETTNGTYFYYTKTITMPSVDANTNVTFNWTYTLEGEENTTSRTASETQLIYNIDMDDCSTYNITALNFSLVEESNNASINGSMDFTFSLAQEGTTVAYSKSVTDRNWTAFCIPNNNIDFTAQLQSEYSAEGYDAHTYFAYNLAITNATQYITYYLTNGTTIVEFTVLNQNGDKVEDAYIKVKKYDIGTGTYKTIETLKTDEQGKALGNIILDTAWYEFVVEYGGTVYLEDGPTKITTTSRTFRINLLTDFFARYTDVIYGITSSLNYTDATGNFRFTWSDPDGNYHYGCLKVTKEGLTGNTLINETCVQSTAGTILININDSGSVNGTYVAVGYIKFDEPYVLQVLRKTWGSLSEAYGKEGLFYAFLIILTVAMVGIFAPKVAMILAVIGLVFSSMLGFFNMNPSWIIALVIAAGLTIYRMRD